MDCLFCKIVAGEIPAEKIFEDEYSLAFLDIEPLAEGHSVVIPKKHAQTLIDLDDDSVKQLNLAIKKSVKKIHRGLSPDGFTIGVNHIIGQAVPHIHFHIIPRWKSDGGGDIHSVVKNPPHREIKLTAEQIRKFD